MKLDLEKILNEIYIFPNIKNRKRFERTLEDIFEYFLNDEDKIINFLATSLVKESKIRMSEILKNTIPDEVNISGNLNEEIFETYETTVTKDWVEKEMLKYKPEENDR